MNDRVRIMLAELVGTAVLVIGGCGTAIFAAGAVDELGFGGVGVLGVATAFGLSLLIMAYAIGHISGCHVNPAVTLGLVIGKKLDAALIPYYWVGQILGGLGAGALLRLVVRAGEGRLSGAGFATNGFDDRSPLGYSLSGVAIVEIVMTAILIFVVLSTTHPRFPVGFGGIAAGVTLWLIHLISIPISNTSVNPARSLAVAPWADGAMGQVWAFIVFPLIGGVVGAIVFLVLNSEGADATNVPDVEGTLKDGEVTAADAV